MVLVATAEWTEMSAAGQALFEAELARAGLADVRSEVEAFVAGPGAAAYPVGDAVVQLVEGRDGRLWVHPPGLVVTEPVRVPRARGVRLQLLRRRADLGRAVPIGMATASFRAARVPSGRPLADGPVVDPEVLRVLLGLWGLESSSDLHER